jgi:hypothetical protein
MKKQISLFLTLILIMFLGVQQTLAKPGGLLDDANTVILLHMDGADGASSFLDESGLAWTASGNARIDATQAVFSQSAFFDGSGDYLSAVDSDDVYFGTKNFTIDFRVRFRQTPGAVPHMIFSQKESYPNDNRYIHLYRDAAQWVFEAYAGSRLLRLAVERPTETQRWYHIALVREGNTFYLFENGIRVGALVSTVTLPNYASPMYIGAGDGSGGYLNGWLDEVRISEVARWNSDFSVPSQAYTSILPTATSTFTPTPIHTATSTSQVIVQATVPAVVIINNDNINQNDTSGSSPSGGNSGSSGTAGNPSSGSFYATTPIPSVGQGGVSVFSVATCGGHYVNVRVYVDENKDRMMSPAEGISGLQVFFLDQSYARLGSLYTVDGQATFCIPQTQYGRTLFVDIPYLQQFGTLQIPESPSGDLELWFPGEPPVLPLFLP